MLVKIPLSSQWQQINLATYFKNNRGIRILIQQTANAGTPPAEVDNLIEGLVIEPYKSFQIPADGNQYWVKTIHGSGEIIVDPTVITAGGGASSGSIFDQGANTTLGAGSYREITLSSDPLQSFQAVITVIGDNDAGLNVGQITVTYVDATTFRVYNTGMADIAFGWIVLIN